VLFNPLFTSVVLAQSSTFIINNIAGSSNLTFSLSIPANSNDFLFRLVGPASQAWISVGTGSIMIDSMMFIAYANAAGKSV
jgi:hypothetical protein